MRSTRRSRFQDEREDGKVTQLSKKNRQMLSHAMKKAENKFKVTLSELYSPPRVTPELGT